MSVSPKTYVSARHVRLKDDYLARVFRGEEFLLFDGAMGTQLQAHGLKAGALPELLCITDPQVVTSIHSLYVQAGSQVVSTNTFGANAYKLGDKACVEDIFTAAVSCAKASGARYVAADIGPTGALLQPMGTMSFDEAYELFAQQVRAATRAGADMFIIETMADLLETKAAILAAKEQSDLPIFATMTFGEDGRTFLGTTPQVAATTLSALGADCIGANCSLGPADIAPLVEQMLPYANCPVMVQANAGLPHVENGATVYSVLPREYCEAVAHMVDAGVTVVGGCCGTSPEYISELRDILAQRTPRKWAYEKDLKKVFNKDDDPEGEGAPDLPRLVRSDFCVTSAQELVSLPMGFVGVIGERINPTGKKRMKEALRSGNYDFIMQEAINQTAAGAQILDVNAGLPEIDEKTSLVRMVTELQGIATCPLQIDSATPEALEAAIRLYPGKPIINSTNAKTEVLNTVVPLAKHYGCALVGLTIDENGIPQTAQERFAIAQKIVAATDAAQIPRQDIVIDCLAMAASTDQRAPHEILKAISLVKNGLSGVRTVLGVSNISFGLPYRELLNATFLSAAFAAGLDLAIINPLSQRYMDVVSSWRALSGEDAMSSSYIEIYAPREAREKAAAAQGVTGSALKENPQGTVSAGSDSSARETAGTPQDAAGLLRDYILTGRKDPVSQVVKTLLQDHDPLDIVNSMLIPALDTVGERFEKGVFFLPQLMASAEAAKAGFETIRENTTQSVSAAKGKFVLAVVQGDVHDIGKNIVKMLLENYGYEVIDLGRDVAPQTVVDAVIKHQAKLAGLSALMTTTIPAMEQTIALLHKEVPECKVVVGGAVLNPEYAAMVGADYYAKDASETVRIAAQVL
ncbi:MAG: homocysteine S-methyltransferase family protein [Coriobacteriales bacterium]|nr:homocysteine S-methyltransferase family protein [Coriobacteriales bacterium]